VVDLLLQRIHWWSPIISSIYELSLERRILDNHFAWNWYQRYSTIITTVSFITWETNLMKARILSHFEKLLKSNLWELMGMPCICLRNWSQSARCGFRLIREFTFTFRSTKYRRDFQIANYLRRSNSFEWVLISTSPKQQPAGYCCEILVTVFVFESIIWCPT
jgi:hypothetical protein